MINFKHFFAGGSMKDYYFQENNHRDPYTYFESNSYAPVEENNYLW